MAHEQFCVVVWNFVSPTVTAVPEDRKLDQSSISTLSP